MADLLTKASKGDVNAIDALAIRFQAMALIDKETRLLWTNKLSKDLMSNQSLTPGELLILGYCLKLKRIELGEDSRNDQSFIAETKKYSELAWKTQDPTVKVPVKIGQTYLYDSLRGFADNYDIEARKRNQSCMLDAINAGVTQAMFKVLKSHLQFDLQIDKERVQKIKTTLLNINHAETLSLEGCTLQEETAYHVHCNRVAFSLGTPLNRVRCEKANSMFAFRRFTIEIGYLLWEVQFNNLSCCIDEDINHPNTQASIYHTMLVCISFKRNNYFGYSYEEFLGLLKREANYFSFEKINLQFNKLADTHPEVICQLLKENLDPVESVLAVLTSDETKNKIQGMMQVSQAASLKV